MAYERRKSESYVNVGGLNTKGSNYVTDTRECLKLTNFDHTVPGAITTRPGSTQLVNSAVSGVAASVYQFNQLSGASYKVFSANTNIYTIQGQAPISFKSSLLSNGRFSFVTFVDRLFATNGQDFFKFDGSQATNYSLPPGASGFAGAATGSGSGFTGAFLYSYGYLNDRGYFGPAINTLTVNVAGESRVFLTGLTTPTGYGITALVFYRSSANGTDPFQIGTLAAGGATFVDNNLSLGTRPAPEALWFTLAPRYLSLFNNELFLIGFSSLPSSVYYSDIGEPESVGASSLFEVRTNDGDRLTGGIPYGPRQMLFKRASFHYLTGDDPNNFSLSEVSTQYGALSHWALCVYKDKLRFLDEKGEAEYNGANTEIVSTRIEDTYRRMNVAAAVDQAAMLHVKARNEIWTIFPIDGATFNNHMVVYDYNADAYSEWSGPQVASISLATNPDNNPWPHFGSYSGAVHYFGPSFFSDNGTGFTCVFGSRFEADLGHSVEKVYRRLFLDVDPTPGVTQPIGINFYRNQGSSVYLARTMYSNQFQSVINFGISAKSLAFDAVYLSATSPLRINGYTLEDRYQRSE